MIPLLNPDDADARVINKYQRDVIAALDQHTANTLPANGPYTADQVKLARATLAQNYMIGDLLKGPYMDLKGLGKIHADSPNLLTGDLRTLGQFAVDHPEVSGLPSAADRFAPPGYASGLGQALGADQHGVGSRLSNIIGVPTGATRMLTGNVEANAAAARSRPVTGANGEFEPRPGMAGPTGGPIGPAPSRQGQLPLAPGAGRVLNPTGGLTASAPTGVRPPAPAVPGSISLADLLSHGVEQRPAPGLSVAPMGAAAPSGMPFAPNLEHAAGGLTLAPEAPRAAPTNLSDLANVMSQGVPEGIVQRSKPGGLTMPVAHAPAFPTGNTGIVGEPIKLGNLNPKQRGAVGEPVNIGPLRALQNQPQTYSNGPIEIPKGAAKKPGAANDKKFGPFRGNPQTLEDFLRENLGDNF